jgi:hypothetical protein
LALSACFSRLERLRLRSFMTLRVPPIDARWYGADPSIAAMNRGRYAANRSSRARVTRGRPARGGGACPAVGPKSRHPAIGRIGCLPCGAAHRMKGTTCRIYPIPERRTGWEPRSMASFRLSSERTLIEQECVRIQRERIALWRSGRLKSNVLGRSKSNVFEIPRRSTENGWKYDHAA